MKKIFYLITAILTLLGCDRANTSGNKQAQSNTDAVTDRNINQADSSILPHTIFTIADAEKILGQQAHLADSSTTMEGNVLTYKCAYTANSKDEKTEKTGIIYFLFEQYAQDSSAHKVYSSIKTSNEKHEGVKELHGMGDEAYFHSDGQNFYFILVRKGRKMFRIKVNKTTSKTSLDEFNLITKNITALL